MLQHDGWSNVIEDLSQTDSLQPTLERRALRSVGATRAIHARAAHRIQIAALIEAFERTIMKASYVLPFLCGATVMLGFSGLNGSDAKSPHHVYELRLYHVNEGKMDALKSRFGDHTDSIFKRHNMR
jgi:hypothetical protein